MAREVQGLVLLTVQRFALFIAVRAELSFVTDLFRNCESRDMTSVGQFNSIIRLVG